jgi:hypothetical protein
MQHWRNRHLSGTSLTVGQQLDLPGSVGRQMKFMNLEIPVARSHTGLVSDICLPDAWACG